MHELIEQSATRIARYVCSEYVIEASRVRDAFHLNAYLFHASRTDNLSERFASEASLRAFLDKIASRKTASEMLDAFLIPVSF